MSKFLLLFVIYTQPSNAVAFHPLRLSLCEVHYSSDEQQLEVTLKLFLTDVNEALTFDPYSKELRFCETNEAQEAEHLLMDYVNQFFAISMDDQKIPLQIVSKHLDGEGDNTALWVEFQHQLQTQGERVTIKNAVFTDLFFDQSNLVYLHVNGRSKSLMLNKKKPEHTVKF